MMKIVDQLPMEIADWTGEEVPVAEEIVRATDTDAHISRRYARSGGFEAVSLWIASGVKARDLMPHRPEVCYVGAGWRPGGRDVLELPMADGAVMPCNVMQFSRGVLNNERVVVLDYYIVDGEYCANVSLLRSRAWKGGAAIGYMAQVQIVTAIPPGTTAEAATDIVSAFAVESGPYIAGLFDRHLEEVAADESDESTEN